LDAQTRRCTVYEQRPNTCRKHPQVGPKPGYCPYGARVKSLTPLQP
ncbi:YkgJ family cysteine cluster protein, partial [Leptothrix ochracea]